MTKLATCYGVTPHGEVLFYNRNQAFAVRFTQSDDPNYTAPINISVPHRGVFKLCLHVEDLQRGLPSVLGFELLLSSDPSKNAGDLIAITYLYAGLDLEPKYPGKKRLSWDKIKRRRREAVSLLQRERRQCAKQTASQRWFKHCAVEKVMVRYFWKQLSLTE